MGNLGSKIAEYAKTHLSKMVVVWVVFITFGVLWAPSKDVVGYLFSDNVSSIVEHIINQSVKDQIEKAGVDFSLKLMQYETKDLRTPKQIDNKIKYWKRNKLNAQLVAMRIIQNSSIAKGALKDSMFNVQCFKAFLSHK